jgi:cell wall-associated NlpC family hydrolase
MKKVCIVLWSTLVFLHFDMKAQNVNPFPEVPPADVSAADDLKQMMWQMGFAYPDLPDKTTHYNEVVLPKLQAFGSDVTFKPGHADKPEGNWTWATGTTTTWPHADGTGDNLVGSATVTRTGDGFWNNYIQEWEPGGAYFTGALFYKPLALHDLTGLTAGGWPARRAQLLEGVREIYGRIPEAAGRLQISWTIDSIRTGEYTITGAITNPSGYTARNTPRITGTLRIPTGLSGNRKIPVVIIFGSDESLWNTMAPADIAVFNFNNTQLQPDRGGQATSSYLIGLVNEGHWRKPGDWGGLVAWSWGVSRLIDFFESEANTTPVDPGYIGLTGHSRYGKATLVTMAYEPRVAFSFPSSSGSLGAIQSRRHVGQEMANSATDPNEYHWIAGSALKYVGLHPGSTDGYMPRKVMDMPVDAESLIALCAPRPVFFGSGRPEGGESWIDPYGTYLAAAAASPVYELLGKKGLVMNDVMICNGQKIPMPVIGKDYIEGDIGYRNHGGGHVAGPNYPAFLEFLQKRISHKVYGVVNVSVADARTEADYAAEMATQLLLGAPVRVLQCDDWWRVRTAEGYMAWITGSSFVRMTKEEFNRWTEAKKIIFTGEHGFAYQNPDELGGRISDLVFGNLLKWEADYGRFHKVSYPDGRVAFILKSQSKPYDDWLPSVALTEAGIIEKALSLKGIPYTWGGTSVKGMDCSGFTKTVMLMHGVILRRDASQQAKTGIPVDISRGYGNLRPGDLMFFGRKAADGDRERIRHVAIYLGDREFIHAAGYVRINSLDPLAPHYDEYNTGEFIRACRIVGAVDTEGIWSIGNHPLYKEQE